MRKKSLNLKTDQKGASILEIAVLSAVFSISFLGIQTNLGNSLNNKAKLRIEKSHNAYYDIRFNNPKPMRCIKNSSDYSVYNSSTCLAHVMK